MVVVCLCATGAAAQTTVDSNGTSGDWSSTSVWTPGVVPNNGGGNSYNVNILNTPNFVTITLDEDVTISSLNIQAPPPSCCGASNLVINGATLTTESLNNGSGIFDAESGTLNVTGTATNESSGLLYIDVAGDVANINKLVNEGTFFIGSGATVNLTGGGPGITDIAAGSSIYLGGALNVINGGVASNALANLNSVEGMLELENGSSTRVTPGSGVLSIVGGVGNGLNVESGSTLNIVGGVTVGGSGALGGLTVGYASTTNIAGNLNNAAYGSVVVDGPLALQTGGTLNVGGSFDNKGYLAVGGSLNVGGTFTNEGDANPGGVDNVGSLVNEGSLTIGGVLNITGGGPGITDVAAGSSIDLAGTLNVINGGVTSSGLANVNNVGGILEFANGQTNMDTPGSGALTITKPGQMIVYGSTLDVNGGLNNSGGVTLFESALNTVGNVVNSGQMDSERSTLNVGGTFTNESGGKLDLDTAGVPSVDQIHQAFVNGGLVDLDSGSLLKVGSYEQLATGTLGEGMLNSDVFDLMDVSGAVSLNGALDLGFGNSTTLKPFVGETFDLINFTPGELTGTFSSFTFDTIGVTGWTIDYDNSAGEILVEVTALQTPEPGSIVLLGTGLIGLWYVGRRKIRRCAA